MNEISINISYKAFYTDYELEDFQGIEELKSELSQHYVSRIKGTPVGRGGGVYEFVIDLIMNTTLDDYLKIIRDGLLFDAIKSGSKSLVLRPFLKAFETFNAKNGGNVAIREYKFLFEETEVVIHSIDDRGVYSVAPQIFERLAQVYSKLLEPNSKRYPNRICIPVVQDAVMAKTEDIPYRELLTDEEEYLYGQLTQQQYLEFWGLEYEFNYAQTEMVFDVKKEILTSDSFYNGNIFERFVLPNLEFDGE